MWRQSGIGRFMRQIVADVREERSLGLDSLHDAQRVFDRGMSRVRLVPQGVEKKNIQSFQLMV